MSDLNSVNLNSTVYNKTKNHEKVNLSSTKDNTAINSTNLTKTDAENMLSLNSNNVTKLLEKTEPNESKHQDKKIDYELDINKTVEGSKENILQSKSSAKKQSFDLRTSNKLNISENPFNKSNLDMYKNSQSKIYIKQNYSEKKLKIRSSKSRANEGFAKIFEDKFTFEKRMRKNSSGNIDSTFFNEQSEKMTSIQETENHDQNFAKTRPMSVSANMLQSVKRDDRYKIDSVHLSILRNMDSFLKAHVNKKIANTKNKKKKEDFHSYNSHALGMKHYMDDHIRQILGDDVKVTNNDHKSKIGRPEKYISSNMMSKSTTHLEKNSISYNNDKRSSFDIKKSNAQSEFSQKNFFVKNDQIDKKRRNSYVDCTTDLNGMYEKNTFENINKEIKNKMGNISSVYEKKSKDNVRVSSAKKYKLGEWMSNSELQYMNRSDSNVVAIRKNIFDAKKKANVFGYHPPTHYENQDTVIRYQESKIYHKKNMSAFYQKDPINADNKEITKHTVQALLSMKNHDETHKISLREIILKHDDIFHLRKWASKVRRSQQECEAEKGKDEDIDQMNAIDEVI